LEASCKIVGRRQADVLVSCSPATEGTQSYACYSYLISRYVLPSVAKHYDFDLVITYGKDGVLKVEWRIRSIRAPEFTGIDH